MKNFISLVFLALAFCANSQSIIESTGKNAQTVVINAQEKLEEWTPPADWIDISKPEDNTINLLAADIGHATVAFSVTTQLDDYTVNWGDELTTYSYASGTIAQHTYTIGTGQQCSLGYTTFKISITSNSGLTVFLIKKPSIISNVGIQSPILSANIGSCEYLTTLTSAFESCRFLKSVYFPQTLTSLTNITSIFNLCTALEYVEFPQYMPSLTNSSYVFYNCINIKKIIVTEGFKGNMSYFCLSCTNLKNIVFPKKLDGVTDLSQFFNSCQSIEYIELPESVTSVTAMNNIFQNCYLLTQVKLPMQIHANISFSSVFDGCKSLKTFTLPPEFAKIAEMGYQFRGCTSLTSVTFPDSMPNLYYLTNTFNGCISLTEIRLPLYTSTNWTTTASCFQGCTNLTYIRLPLNTPATTLGNMFQDCYSLKTIDNLENLGSQTSECDGYYLFRAAESITTATINAKLSRIHCNGPSATYKNKLSSLRLLNSMSTFSHATSPQVDISYTSLDAAAINQVFTDLPVVTGKTIKITGASGAAGCTQSIATTKGWTVSN